MLHLALLPLLMAILRSPYRATVWVRRQGSLKLRNVESWVQRGPSYIQRRMQRRMKWARNLVGMSGAANFQRAVNLAYGGERGAFEIPNEDDAGQTDQAEPDAVDFKILAGVGDRTGVVEGCLVTQDAPTTQVDIAAGTIMVQGEEATVATGVLSPGAAHATLDRFDLVAVNSSGVKSLIAGTADANPVFPTTGLFDAEGRVQLVILAALLIKFHAATTVNVLTADITDKRMFCRMPSRSATYFIAAVDASEQSQAMADFTCSGTADDVDIQLALDALPGVGGLVILSEGTFSCTADVLVSEKQYLKGSGYSTIVRQETNGQNMITFNPEDNQIEFG